jgi:hypothetical protein
MTTAQTAQGSMEARGLSMALARGWDDWTGGAPSAWGQPHVKSPSVPGISTGC